MINVLYVVSTLKRGGPNNVLYNLISEINRDLFNPKILTLSKEDGTSTSLWNDFLKLNVVIQSLNLSRFKGFINGKSMLKAFAKNNHIDVIHIYGFRGDLMVNKSDFKNIKLVSTINSNIYDDYTMLYGNLKGKLMAYLHIKSLKGKLAVGCSSAISKQLFSRYKIKTSVIRNGIPKNLYKINTQDVNYKYKNLLDIPVDKKVFLFVGSLIIRKDPITVIKGFLKATNAINNCYLIMVGDGPLMESCKELANGATNIKFLGTQPETLKFLKASDYYISASHSEGLPTSVMEAMSCGLPVVLSNIEPHQELVNEIKDWKYVFPINNIQELANKIADILVDDYKVLSQQCRNIIENNINSNLMTLEYESIYLNKDLC
jgi:glycosyltransferase involved in cell wall biosynthesis